MLDVLARAIRQEEEMKVNGLERNKNVIICRQHDFYAQKRPNNLQIIRINK